MLDRSKGLRKPPKGDIKLQTSMADTVQRIVNRMPEARDVFRETLSHCASTNPRALRFIVAMMAIYLHVGPFSRKVIATIDRQIAALHNQRSMVPAEARESVAAATM